VSEEYLIVRIASCYMCSPELARKMLESARRNHSEKELEKIVDQKEKEAYRYAD